METLLKMWPLLLGLAAIGFGGQYLATRKDRRKDDVHVAALREMAAPLNGAVLTRGQADGWSAALWPPFEMTTRGLRRFSVRRKPRFDVAVEFTRGPWRVRISEASIRQRSASRHVNTHYEHRIDIVTADLPPLKVAERRDTDLMGKPLDPNSEVALLGAPIIKEPPATVAQRQDHWVQAAISAPANQHLAAFTSDHAAAARMLNAHATSWLLDRQRRQPHRYTFESGLLYTTSPGRIDPFEATETVNTMLGLLDCIPGAAPAGAVAGAVTGAMPAQADHATTVQAQVEGENHLIAEPPPSAAEVDEQKSSQISTLGFIGIAIAGVALLLGLFGYGSVNLINGVATAAGLTKSVDVRVISELEWTSAQDRKSPNAVGEYTVEGRTHQVGLGGGEVGDVIEGHFPALPIDWVGFPDEPMTGWGPFWSIVVGLVCFAFLVLPFILARGSSAQPQVSSAPRDPTQEPTTRPE
ncbi:MULTISPECIES: hypothetical protein [Prauserella salsuginis group]|uniref:RING-type E3 ubiquitin transferase n=1 Tax=Prauserella salsuginis TaxID=387889 RepID=A0ABW6G2H6_9PSEU|nr:MULTISPECIES: hypothetical protein [Prauserella salsuginis group]MCR3719856.1 hypothetical protein [Prauserella flava]MCR3736601.1 hypothetical protein [Prauserella salsuginis]